jgi:hypothetical protein
MTTYGRNMLTSGKLILPLLHKYDHMHDMAGGGGWEKWTLMGGEELMLYVTNEG